MWDIVRVSPQGHRSVSVSRYFLLQAPQCPSVSLTICNGHTKQTSVVRRESRKTATTHTTWTKLTNNCTASWSTELFLHTHTKQLGLFNKMFTCHTHALSHNSKQSESTNSLYIMYCIVVLKPVLFLIIINFLYFITLFSLYLIKLVIRIPSAAVIFLKYVNSYYVSVWSICTQERY